MLVAPHKIPYLEYNSQSPVFTSLIVVQKIEELM